MAPVGTADDDGAIEFQPEVTAPERRVDGLPPRPPATRQQSTRRRSESVPRTQTRRPQSAKQPTATGATGFDLQLASFTRGQQWRPPNESGEGASAPVRSNSVGSRRHSCSGGLLNSQRLAQGSGTQRLKELERVANVEVVLRSKNLSDKEAMAAFRVRNGLEESAKIFVFDSTDEHIRQALLGASHRWVENEVPQSAFWDFKWCATDSEADYRNLLEGTLYNHFQNNRELTTKVGLLQNLRQLCVNDMVDIDSFFPRCYDMSCASEHKDFILDYRRGAAFTVATVHVQMAQKNLEGYLCNLDILRHAERILVAWVRDLDSSFVEEAAAKSSERSISEGDWDALVLYSQLGEGQLVLSTADCEKGQTAPGQQREPEIGCPEFGYTVSGSQAAPRWPPWPDDDRTPRKRKVCRPADVRCWQEFTSHQWAAQVSPVLQESLEKVLDDLVQYWRQAGVQGSTNAWILKPCTSSKGSGVVCMRSLPKLLHQCSVGSNRIVQKYIERPLLLSSGHKFDIRQWVLVKSFQPLQVYMFSDCYLRLCNEPFDLRDLANRQRHITNWTVNKHGKNFNEGAVLSVSDFSEFLQEITGEPEYWQDVLRPRLKDIILHCLNSVRDKMVQRTNSFELYGFDFLISEDLAPWLLEVNLSPACESRTPWMSTMLERMASQLVDIVQGAHLVQDGGSHWMCIAEEQDDEHSAAVGQLAPEMCLVGRRLNVNHERRFERGFRRHLAGELLRRVAHGFVGRLKARRKRQGNAALRIQRVARQYLARRHVRAVRQHAMAKIIQSVCKQLLATKDMQKRRWTECAVACQRHWRGVLGRRKAHHRLLQLRATMIQRTWRGWALRRRLRAKRTIFAWWRCRYRQMRIAARRIQTRVRVMLARLKRRRLAVVWQASCALAKVVTLARWRHQADRSIAVAAAVFAQRLWRGYKGRQVALERSLAKSALQLWSRCFRVRRQAVTDIARNWRGLVARRVAARKRACLVKIQAFKRAVAARRHVQEIRERNAAELLRRRNAAVRIQATQRGSRARRCASLRRAQVVLVQAAARRWLARKELGTRRRWAARRQRWKTMLQARGGEQQAEECVQSQGRIAAKAPVGGYPRAPTDGRTRAVFAAEHTPAANVPKPQRSQSQRHQRLSDHLEASHDTGRREPQASGGPVLGTEKVAGCSRLARDRRKLLTEGTQEEQWRGSLRSVSKDPVATDCPQRQGSTPRSNSQGAAGRVLSRGARWKNIESDRARFAHGYPEASREVRPPCPSDAWSFSTACPLEGPIAADGYLPCHGEPPAQPFAATAAAPHRIEAARASRAGKPPKRHLSGGALQTARQLRSMPTSPSHSHGQEFIGRSVSRARRSLEDAASKLLAMCSVSSQTPMQVSCSRSEGRKPHLPPRLNAVAP
mmetsp:Transcript_6459/g.15704  ORF Transcript_6459/g.15704 Transcript_6459/m.15704 type:complete len:1394 (+) Transcript_6459:99-4280(+)